MASLADLLMQAQQNALQPRHAPSGVMSPPAGNVTNMVASPSLSEILSNARPGLSPNMNPVVGAYQQRAMGSAYFKGNPQKAKESLLKTYPGLAAVIDKPDILVYMVRQGKGHSTGASSALADIYGLTHIDGKSLTPGFSSEEFPDDPEKTRRPLY